MFEGRCGSSEVFGSICQQNARQGSICLVAVMVKLNLTTYCGKQCDYKALEKAARCRNPEIFHLLYENGIGINANPISAAIDTYDVDSEKSEEEKLETVKMLSKMPEFATSTNVRIC